MAPQHHRVIASIAFRNFKALRSTQVALAPFNLVIGPNGSGKTSLIEAVMRLKTLAKLPLAEGQSHQKSGGPEIEFGFVAPHDGIIARLGCVSDVVCDTLRIAPANAPGWPALRAELAGLRSHALQHEALAGAAKRDDGAKLSSSGHNLAAVLAHLRAKTAAQCCVLRASWLQAWAKQARSTCCIRRRRVSAVSISASCRGRAARALPKCSRAGWTRCFCSASLFF